MPDKQTLKTFKEWSDKVIPLSFTTSPEYRRSKEAWNAATEATRAEYDDKIKAMQAEIDKRDTLLTRIKDDLIWARQSFYLPQKVLDNQRTLITKIEKSTKPARER